MNRPLQISIAVVAILLFASSGFGVGCTDTTFDPFVNEGRYYTVYGFLDVRESTHAVRVIPITRRQELIETRSSPQANIDARVFSTDSFTEQTIEWRHSLERLSDGTFGHIYRATFDVRSRATYTLTIERSDGIVTTAQTTVPAIQNPSPILEVGPLQFSADSTLITQEIYTPDISTPWDIQLRYGIGGGLINGERVLVPYGRSGEGTEDGGWRFTINVTEDRPEIDEAIARNVDIGFINEGDPVILTSMGVQYRILDAEWVLPNGVLDAELLAQPGTVSNVEAGYGYWGSIGFYVEEWNTEAISPLLGFS